MKTLETIFISSLLGCMNVNSKSYTKVTSVGGCSRYFVWRKYYEYLFVKDLTLWYKASFTNNG